MSKALLIKSYTTLTTGTQGNWNDLNMASSYIQVIQTGKILEAVSADKIAALISGVPTPWARFLSLRLELWQILILQFQILVLPSIMRCFTESGEVSWL